MSEYLIKPDPGPKPLGTKLLEEIHRRGFPVEITLTGPDEDWSAIRFMDAGPPEAECLLSFEAGTNAYKVVISRDAPRSAVELQLYLVETLLQEVGGYADHTGTRERLDHGQFIAKLRAHAGDAPKTMDWVWLVFSWLVVVAALTAFLQVQGPNRWTVLVVMIFALVSAAGLTWSHFKHE